MVLSEYRQNLEEIEHAHVAAYDVFRASRDAVNALGSPGEPGEAVFAVHPRKTIALKGN